MKWTFESFATYLINRTKYDHANRENESSKSKRNIDVALYEKIYVITSLCDKSKNHNNQNTLRQSSQFKWSISSLLVRS